jgi:murein DD-endopeptidase MepM/ murein hydrolase activator NlpD
MKGLSFCKYARLAILASILAGMAVLATLALSYRAEAQPTTFVSPQAAPPFLSVPYYGAKRLTSYLDHEFPNYQINNRIVLYDGRVIPSTNGACAWSRAGQAIGYCAVPGQVPCVSCILYEGHSGNDFSLDYEPVLAVADGTVTTAWWDNWNDRYAGYGLHLRISHSGGYETIYGHLSALAVITNAMVSRSQIIGTSGNTGASSGAHLHFEVRLDDNPTDPFGGAGSQWLWRDGAWNAQGRWVGHPEPRYGTTFIVDDDNPATVGDPGDDPNFTKGHGDWGGPSCPPDNCDYWWRDPNVGYNADMLYTYVNGDTDDYWASWQPPRPGLYDVQVWIPSQNGTTWAARYWLISSYWHMPGIYMIVDQWGASNRWISLGIYRFGSYSWQELWISDATSEGPNAHEGQANLCYYTSSGNWLCRLAVDAIRFRAPWPVYIPVALKNY